MMKILIKRIHTTIEKILGMRLLYRMTLIYIIGGALPLILTGSYLVNGMNQILMQQEKDAKVVEIKSIERELQETLNTVNAVSLNFFFDQKLENIALNSYKSYQDNVDDFKEYKNFEAQMLYYMNIIQMISIYIDNDTMAGNAKFVKVNENILGQAWYKEAVKGKGAVLWRYIQASNGDKRYLSLVRLIRTKKHQNVGVLAINVKSQRLMSIINGKKSNLLILLNKKESITSSGDNLDLEEVQKLLPVEEQEIVSKKVTYHEEEYLMTYADMQLPESVDHIQIVSLHSYQDILKEAHNRSKSSTLFLIFSFAISTILIILFSRSFSLRVNLFCKQMQKAASGNFNLEKKMKGNDEISEMYEYLSAMIWSIQNLLAEIYQEQLHKERLKTKQKDIEFKMLASQINPHFLYNTLETIRMMARVQGNYDIEELVKMLSSILRHNIQVGNQEVTIKSEVDILTCYLRIQQYRFGDRIQYRIHVQEGLEDQKILPLIIQPIVENSIIHGLEAKESAGNISIDIKRNGLNILILVEDDGLGMESDRLEKLQKKLYDFNNIEKTHIGLCNVNQRINLLYGDAYGVTVCSEKDKGTRVEIVIPFHEVGERIG
jgi:two-component system, sensor histidine kinase YesM